MHAGSFHFSRSTQMIVLTKTKQNFLNILLTHQMLQITINMCVDAVLQLKIELGHNIFSHFYIFLLTQKIATSFKSLYVQMIALLFMARYKQMLKLFEET